MPYNLEYLLSTGQAIEIIPNILYFATSPERPPLTSEQVSFSSKRQNAFNRSKRNSSFSPANNTHLMSSKGEGILKTDTNPKKEGKEGNSTFTQSNGMKTSKKAKTRSDSVLSSTGAHFTSDNDKTGMSNLSHAGGTQHATFDHLISLPVCGNDDDEALNSIPPRARTFPDQLLLDDGNGGGCLLQEDGFYFSIHDDDAFQYKPFFADFGPLDIGCVVRFSRRLARLLEVGAGYKWQEEQVTSSHPSHKLASSAAHGSQNTKTQPNRDSERTFTIPVLRPPARAVFPQCPPIVFLSGLHSHERVNNVTLLGAFCLLTLRWSLNSVQRLFTRLYPPLIPFRDASSGASNYPLSALDVISGLRHALHLGWLNIVEFDLDAYEMAKALDFTWIVPHKMIAMSSPEDDKPFRNAQQFVNTLRPLGVTMVVRLNEVLYEAGTFKRCGISHLDLEFPDGTAPIDGVLKTFLQAVEEEFGEAVPLPSAAAVSAASLVGDNGRQSRNVTSAGSGREVGGVFRGLPPACTRDIKPRRAESASVNKSNKKKAAPKASPPSHHGSAKERTKGRGQRGVVAIHCRAGLGRTGTVIAVYIMRHYGFTAREAIGWVRLCRPGSITGIQQQYLEKVERRLTPPARAWTDAQAGQQMLRDSSPLAYQAHGNVSMDPDISGAGVGGSSNAEGSTPASPNFANSSIASLNNNNFYNGVGTSTFIKSNNQSGNNGNLYNWVGSPTRNSFSSGPRLSFSAPFLFNTAGGLNSSNPVNISNGNASLNNNPSGTNVAVTGMGSLRRTNTASPPLMDATVLNATGGRRGSRQQLLSQGVKTGNNNLSMNNNTPTNNTYSAPEQRYELAEMEALLCEPSFVPHKSILENLKYPSSYFLALEQKDPFGRAVQLQNQFAARRRQRVNNAATADVTLVNNAAGLTGKDKDVSTLHHSSQNSVSTGKNQELMSSSSLHGVSGEDCHNNESVQGNADSLLRPWTAGTGNLKLTHLTSANDIRDLGKPAKVHRVLSSDTVRGRSPSPNLREGAAHNTDSTFSLRPSSPLPSAMRGREGGNVNRSSNTQGSTNRRLSDYAPPLSFTTNESNRAKGSQTISNNSSASANERFEALGSEELSPGYTKKKDNPSGYRHSVGESRNSVDGSPNNVTRIVKGRQAALTSRGTLDSRFRQRKLPEEMLDIREEIRHSLVGTIDFTPSATPTAAMHIGEAAETLSPSKMATNAHGHIGSSNFYHGNDASGLSNGFNGETLATSKSTKMPLQTSGNSTFYGGGTNLGKGSASSGNATTPAANINSENRALFLANFDLGRNLTSTAAWGRPTQRLGK